MSMPCIAMAKFRKTLMTKTIRTLTFSASTDAPRLKAFHCFLMTPSASSATSSGSSSYIWVSLTTMVMMMAADTKKVTASTMKAFPTPNRPTVAPPMAAPIT